MACVSHSERSTLPEDSLIRRAPIAPRTCEGPATGHAANKMWHCHCQALHRLLHILKRRHTMANGHAVFDRGYAFGCLPAFKNVEDCAHLGKDFGDLR